MVLTIYKIINKNVSTNSRNHDFNNILNNQIKQKKYNKHTNRFTNTIINNKPQLIATDKISRKKLRRDKCGRKNDKIRFFI